MHVRDSCWQQLGEPSYRSVRHLDLQVLVVTDRQLARRQQQKLVDFGAPQQELANTRGEREPRPGWLLVSAQRIAGNEQGTGLLSTIQVFNRMSPAAQQRDVDS